MNINTEIQKRLSEYGIEVNLSKANIDKLPFTDNFFECIIAKCVGTYKQVRSPSATDFYFTFQFIFAKIFIWNMFQALNSETFF